ncbi:hypothetical protein PYCC9005_006063 [Savitreella phatthalungensis]
MRAVRVARTGGREVMQLQQVPVPVPGPKQTLVRNSFAGINFIDTYFRAGLYPSKLPMTLGKEGAGVVISVGEGQDRFKPGDRVVYSASSGSYAEYTIVDTNAIVKIPEHISEEVAASSFIQGLTAITLTEATYKVKKDDWVLVHAAAGGMGGWLVQILKAKGAIVIATASTGAKLEIAKRLGADHVIRSDDDVAAKVLEIVPEGVHCVFDGVGKTTFDTSLASLRRLGFLASYGNASGAVEPLTILRLAPKCITLARPQLFGYLATEAEMDHWSRRLWTMLAEHSIEIPIHKHYQLEEIRQAHEDLESRRSTGKLLVKL